MWSLAPERVITHQLAPERRREHQVTVGDHVRQNAMEPYDLGEEHLGDGLGGIGVR